MRILKKVTKATIDVVRVPISLTADFITLGGALNEKQRSYTGKNLEQIKKDAQEIYRLLDED